MMIREASRELVTVPCPAPVWRSRPAPKPARILGRLPACPREALAAAVARGNDSYAALSRMINRPDRYLDRFVRDGYPLALTEWEHRVLADYFGVEPRGLGIRDLWLRDK